MDLEINIRKGAKFLLRSPPFMVLTGAGISVESGLPPFRGPGGIWTRFDPEEYGHIDTFRSNPDKAWVLLEELVKGTISCVPNEAHKALARLENIGLCGPVVTQNVDGFHTSAGSRDVLDVHGDARRILCPVCGKTEVLADGEIDRIRKRCDCGAYLRPDIVFYGEGLPEEKIERSFDIAMSGVDLLVIGTSGIVMPVAQIPYLVKSSGGKVVEINTAPSALTYRISDVFIKSMAVPGMISLEKAIMEIHKHDSPKGFK